MRYMREADSVLEATTDFGNWSIHIAFVISFIPQLFDAELCRRCRTKPDASKNELRLTS